ncbi:hypothetical protein Acsp03_16910 [Actinomadura sp. NBRC 104412]|nr:hypothetical protein Acsp03_16910 [Actinomadura sp. NBRC 104412]
MRRASARSGLPAGVGCGLPAGAGSYEAIGWSLPCSCVLLWAIAARMPTTIVDGAAAAPYAEAKYRLRFLAEPRQGPTGATAGG